MWRQIIKNIKREHWTTRLCLLGLLCSLAFWVALFGAFGIRLQLTTSPHLPLRTSNNGNAYASSTMPSLRFEPDRTKFDEKRTTRKFAYERWNAFHIDDN